MRTDILPDPDALAAAARDEIADWLSAPGHTTIGLAGGSTPRATYRLLRATELPWERIDGWVTDERHVPLTDPTCNSGMAADALFDHVPARLHAVPYDDDPRHAAAAYASTLHELLARADGEIGLVLLGVGSDGHTASLFPGTEALLEAERDYTANWVETMGTWRLTATLPLLRRASRTVFLVSGAGKARVVREILEERVVHPARTVSDEAKDPIWLIDEAAASGLEAP